MAIKLNAATGGGSVALDAPNSTDSNADVVLTLPTNDGDSGQYLQTNGTGTLSWQTVTVPTVEWTDLGSTAFPNSSSQVSLTGISTNARVIRVVISDLSVGDTATPQLRFRLGNGSESSTGYDYSISYAASNQSSANQGNLNLIHTDFSSAANIWQGNIDILSSQSHMIAVWQLMGIGGTGQCINGAGRWRGGAAIDRINFTTASFFDGGHFAVYTLD